MTQEEANNFLLYDKSTGKLYFNNTTSTRFRKGDPAGSSRKRDGYTQIKYKNKMYLAHRLIWLIAYGEFPKGFLDHINGNKQDNRLCNLRDVTKNINCQNQRNPSKNNTTGFLGVSKKGNRYYSQIRIKGSKKFLGYTTTAEEAYQNYLIAKREGQPGCTL